MPGWQAAFLRRPLPAATCRRTPSCLVVTRCASLCGTGVLRCASLCVTARHCVPRCDPLHLAVHHDVPLRACGCVWLGDGGAAARRVVGVRGRVRLGDGKQVSGWCRWGAVASHALPLFSLVAPRAAPGLLLAFPSFMLLMSRGRCDGFVTEHARRSVKVGLLLLAGLVVSLSVGEVAFRVGGAGAQGLGLLVAAAFALSWLVVQSHGVVRAFRRLRPRTLTLRRRPT